MTQGRPRILLADDHAGVRAAISRLLARSCDVVGFVADVPTLLQTTAQLQPDVVLLDLSLPGRPGVLEGCRRLKATSPHVSVIVFTAQDDEDTKRATAEAGASAFVLKPRAAHDLLATIQRVLSHDPARPTSPGQSHLIPEARQTEQPETALRLGHRTTGSP